NGGVWAERADECEQRVEAEIDEECGTAAETVGKCPDEQRADEHSEEARAEHHRQRRRTESKRFREDSTEHAPEKDVEQVEEQAEADDDGETPVRAGERSGVKEFHRFYGLPSRASPTPPQSGGTRHPRSRRSHASRGPRLVRH